MNKKQGDAIRVAPFNYLLTNMSLPFGYTQWIQGELQPNSLTSTPAPCWLNEPNHWQTKVQTVSLGEKRSLLLLPNAERPVQSGSMYVVSTIVSNQLATDIIRK